jgi:hypothetical protein
MWSWLPPAQHTFAVIGTFVGVVATLLQGGHALKKAEHEKRKGETAASTGQGGEKNKPGLLRVVWEAVGPYQVTALDFDARHFRHVATLWFWISAGTLMALIAELVDAVRSA